MQWSFLILIILCNLFIGFWLRGFVSSSSKNNSNGNSDNINSILWLNNKDESKTEKDIEFEEIIKNAKLLSQKADYLGANEILNKVIHNNKFDEKYIVKAKLQCAKNILLDDSLNTDEPLKL